jgi:prevent-host-death family protein
MVRSQGGASTFNERCQNMSKNIKATPISATDLQRLSAKIIRRAYLGEHFIVERGRIPIIAIMPLSEYRDYAEWIHTKQNSNR